MKKYLTILAVVLPVMGVYSMQASAEVLDRCYQEAGNDQSKIGECLKAELKLVQSEYKDVIERVTVIAKAWDKPNRNRVRWDKLMRTNQSFDGYVKRECDFMKSTTKGNSAVEDNAALACRINLYRMRTDMFENHYLSSAKE